MEKLKKNKMSRDTNLAQTTMEQFGCLVTNRSNQKNIDDKESLKWHFTTYCTVYDYCKQDRRALLRAKYCPHLSCRQKRIKTFDL